jgi:hypothetical protein
MDSYAGLAIPVTMTRKSLSTPSGNDSKEKGRNRKN